MIAAYILLEVLYLPAAGSGYTEIIFYSLMCLLFLAYSVYVIMHGDRHTVFYAVLLVPALSSLFFTGYISSFVSGVQMLCGLLFLPFLAVSDLFKSCPAVFKAAAAILWFLLAYKVIISLEKRKNV